MGSEIANDTAEAKRDDLYEAAAQQFGHVLDRIAAGNESDRDRRHDLRQEIHFQLWRSLSRFDGRCSLKTWVLRVAHNTAVSYVSREHRLRSRLVSLEHAEQAAEQAADDTAALPDSDRTRALEELARMILQLKPLDRQIILCYLEELDAAAIADITGLSPANVAMKIYRIKNILARRFHQEKHHA